MLVTILLSVPFCLAVAINSEKTAHVLSEVSASQRSELQKAWALKKGTVPRCFDFSSCQAFDAAYGTLSFDHANYDKYLLVAET